MAIKVSRLRVLLWKIKCSRVFQFPPAFWFGFWFVFGAYWCVVAIGLVSDLGRLIVDLVIS
jgi:hypothetical protein